MRRMSKLVMVLCICLVLAGIADAQIKRKIPLPAKTGFLVTGWVEARDKAGPHMTDYFSVKLTFQSPIPIKGNAPFEVYFNNTKLRQTSPWVFEKEPIDEAITAGKVIQIKMVSSHQTKIIGTYRITKIVHYQVPAPEQTIQLGTFRVFPVTWTFPGSPVNSQFRLYDQGANQKIFQKETSVSGVKVPANILAAGKSYRIYHIFHLNETLSLQAGLHPNSRIDFNYYYGAMFYTAGK